MRHSLSTDYPTKTWGRLQNCEFLIRGAGRAIPIPVHQAKKPEMRVLRRVKLVPRLRRRIHQVVLLNPIHRLAHQNGAPTPQDQHGVDVIVALQRRVPSRFDLKVSKLRGQALLGSKSTCLVTFCEIVPDAGYFLSGTAGQRNAPVSLSKRPHRCVLVFLRHHLPGDPQRRSKLRLKLFHLKILTGVPLRNTTIVLAALPEGTRGM
jgi:hypothetical protein